MVDFLAGLAGRAAGFTPAEAAVTRHGFRALLAGAPAAVASLPSALGAAREDRRRGDRGSGHCRAPVTLTIESGRVESEPAPVVIWAADLDPTRSVREYA